MNIFRIKLAMNFIIGACVCCLGVWCKTIHCASSDGCLEENVIPGKFEQIIIEIKNLSTLFNKFFIRTYYCEWVYFTTLLYQNVFLFFVCFCKELPCCNICYYSHFFCKTNYISTLTDSTFLLFVTRSIITIWWDCHSIVFIHSSDFISD